MEGVLRRLSSPTFVGRTDELAVLDGALERAAGGVPAFAFIAGESGVGKSRLIAEFEARAPRGHDDALAGAGLRRPLPRARRHRRSPTPRWSTRCAPSPASSATAATTARGARARDPRRPRRADAGVRRAPRRRCAPRARRAPGRQARLFEALLVAARPPRPRQAGRRSCSRTCTGPTPRRATSSPSSCAPRAREPLALIVTYRSDELHRRHPLRPLLAELERAPGVERLGLDRFALAEVEAQLTGDPRRAARGRASPSACTRAPRATRSTPRSCSPRASDECAALPETLRDALLTRVERLSGRRPGGRAHRRRRRAPDAATGCSRRWQTVAPDELMAARARGGRRPGAGHPRRRRLRVPPRAGRRGRLRRPAAGRARRRCTPRSPRRSSSTRAARRRCRPAASPPSSPATGTPAHDLPRALARLGRGRPGRQRVFALREALRHFERALEIWAARPRRRGARRARPRRGPAPRRRRAPTTPARPRAPSRSSARRSPRSTTARDPLRAAVAAGASSASYLRGAGERGRLRRRLRARDGAAAGRREAGARRACSSARDEHDAARPLRAGGPSSPTRGARDRAQALRRRRARAARAQHARHDARRSATPRRASRCCARRVADGARPRRPQRAP